MLLYSESDPKGRHVPNSKQPTFSKVIFVEEKRSDAASQMAKRSIQIVRTNYYPYRQCLPVAQKETMVLKYLNGNKATTAYTK